MGIFSVMRLSCGTVERCTGGTGTAHRAKSVAPFCCSAQPFYRSTVRPSFIWPLRPRPNHRAHGADALLGKTVGREIRRNPLRARDLENFANRVVDLVGFP